MSTTPLTPAPVAEAPGKVDDLTSAINRQSRLLTADQILGMDDLNTMDLEIPEWPVNGEPGIIRLKTLSAREALNFQKTMNLSPANRDNAMISIVVLSAVDDAGNRIFTNAQVERLREKSVKVFTRIQKAAMELNGFGEPDNKAAKGN